MRSFSLIFWSLTLSSCLVSCGNSNREYTSTKFCSISPFECIKEKRNIEMVTNKGKITFEYKDLEQLNKIIEIIKSNY